MKMAELKRLFADGRWRDVIRLAESLSKDSADADYDLGLAHARLKQWPPAKAAFLRGERMAPRDARFPTELAGVAFARKHYAEAETDLRRALKLQPNDAYAQNFLATVFLLEGNLPAALQYWNKQGAPRIESIRINPQPPVSPPLLSRAFAFSPGDVLRGNELRTTDALLGSLGIFSNPDIQLEALPSGSFSAGFSPAMRGDFGGGWENDLLALARGLPYDTIYPEWFNLRGGAVNFKSLLRWDPNKERVSASLSGPIRDNPRQRYTVALDARRENWNLTRSFFDSAAPVTNMQLESVKGSVGIESIVNGRFKWNVAASISGRTFRNVSWSNPSAARFFQNGAALEYQAGLSALLFDDPVHRLNLRGGVSTDFGRMLTRGTSPFEQVQTAIRLDWLPRPAGDDFEMTLQARGGKSWGPVPFDDLFMLGLERDNDLWMRAHIGTEDGRKGNAPLGRNYALFNWDDSKNIYHNAFFGVKLGPFVDAGTVADPTGDFGSRGWMLDAGIALKVKVLGSATVELFFGKDLRTGRFAFYGTSAAP